MTTKATPKSVHRTWQQTNDLLRNCDEKTAWELLKQGIKDKLQYRFLVRIHARANKLRRERELKELSVAA